MLDGPAALASPGPAPGFARRHRLFGLALAVGALIRLVAVVGFHPALWFNDSFEYVSVALRPQPYVVRPDGYSFLLLVLRPLHSFTLVVVLQHLMGLAVGTLVYLLCRRYRLGPWGATAAALPVLLDGNGIAIEHLVLSDTLFTFLVAAAVTVLLLPSARGARPGLGTAAGAGALLAAAILTRTVGLVIAVVLVVWLLARWPGWRAFALFVVALAVPVAGYAGWYHSAHGRYGLTGADGAFLYSRTATFANCATMHPPADLAYLCPTQPSGHRGPPSDYLWHLNQPLRIDPRPVFGGAKNDDAKRFAELAIRSQPLAYLVAVLRDFARTFEPGMANYPSAGLVDHYRFSAQPQPVPGRTFVVGGSAIQDATAYEHGSPATRLTQPFATVVGHYQRFVTVPGPALAVLLLAGLAGGTAGARRCRPLARSDRENGRSPRSRRAEDRPGADAAILLSATAFALLVAPPALAGFDYRYIPPSLGFLGAGAAIGLAAWPRSAADAGGLAVPAQASRTRPGQTPVRTPRSSPAEATAPAEPGRSPGHSERRSPAGRPPRPIR